jgi:cytidylate kinase
MFTMLSTEELNQKLQELDAEFDREMRTRGFDPAQAENVALPSHLAALYAEREKIKAQIEESEGKKDD